MSLVVLHHLAVLRSVVRPNSGQPSNAALVDVIPCLPNQAHAVGYRRPRVLATDRQAPVDGGTESPRVRWRLLFLEGCSSCRSSTRGSFRERAVRLVAGHRSEYATEYAAIRSIA